MNLPNPYESPQVDPRDTSDPEDVLKDLRRPHDQLHWLGVIWTVLVIFVFRIVSSAVGLMM